MELPDLPILSDLDGTLIDSTRSVVAAFRWWAARRGLRADIVDRLPFGRTSADAAAMLAPHLDAVQEGALLDDRQAQDTDGVVAFDGAGDLLASARRLAVVTSGPERLAAARLRAAGLPRPPFLVTPECWTRGKPDPEPYLVGARVLGVLPRDCVVLEDAPAGVESGRAAGMRVIAMLTTHRREALPGASAYLESLRQLPGALHSLAVEG
jgi:mannitol-1-/sugar-/sorbitol-6-phosphatase